MKFLEALKIMMQDENAIFTAFDVFQKKFRVTNNEIQSCFIKEDDWENTELELIYHLDKWERLMSEKHVPTKPLGCFLDYTYCASENCENKCGRKMSDEIKEAFEKIVHRGIAFANFCD